MSLKHLQYRLGYPFKDDTLLKEALTHASCGPDNNERLEFLGDAALGFFMASKAFRRYSSEGEMTQAKKTLTKNKELAKRAIELGLDKCLIVNKTVTITDKMLADAVEALIAAVLLDGGLTACHDVIEAIFDIDKLLDNPHKDYKSRLQEEIQGKYKDLPVYSLVEEEGPPHDRIYVSEVKYKKVFRCIGRGKSRKESEQHAAKLAIEVLGA